MITCVFKKMSITWLLHLEDSYHLWVKHEGSPVLMHLRLADRLTSLQLRHLCLASPFQPVRVDVAIGDWNGTSFWATLGDIHCPMPLDKKKTTCRKRRGFAKPMRV